MVHVASYKMVPTSSSATSRSLSLSSGMLIAVPVPQESAIDSVEQIIQQSLCEARYKPIIIHNLKQL